MPTNSVENTRLALQLLGWESIADKYVSIALNDEHGSDTDTLAVSFSGMTVAELLRRHIDITARPKRYFFQLAACFATEKGQKEKLVYFASAEGQVHFHLI